MVQKPRVALPAFGGDVARSPGDEPFTGQRAFVQEFGQAKVQQADSTTAHGIDQEDVAGLEIAVHDASLVGYLERVHDGFEKLDELGDLEPSVFGQEFVEKRLEVPPIQHLHHQVGEAPFQEAKVVDVHRVGVA